ncbi:MAG: DUF4240 domain-containing protein, partial [Planctomycetota bacterium]|nr:DUF4240 domain-containing protein [Planctomycetota bacterium]
MYTFLIHATPDPTKDRDEAADGAAGAFVTCWIDFQEIEGAEVLARHYISDSGWIPGVLHETKFVSREDYDGEDGELIEYFDEAVEIGLCLSIHCYPPGDGDEMEEFEFWNLIGELDWNQAGDDEAVCEPLVKALAERQPAAIEGFAEHLAQKLHALDTEAHARHTGGNSYGGPDEPFSVDGFLYARCCVVANGRQAFDAILKDPSAMPEDMEFEALLAVASSAHERQTGKDFDFDASVCY